MQYLEIVSITLGCALLALIAAASLPAIVGVSKKLNLPKRHGYTEAHHLYQDEDGTATEETQKNFSTAIPVYLALISSFTGFLLSIATSVFSTLHPNDTLFVESWIIFGSWTLIVTQALNLFFEHEPLERFNSGLYGAVSSAALLITIVAQNGLFRSRISGGGFYTVHIALTTVQIAAASLWLIACLFIPRRPLVSEDGKPIDRQYTVSAFSRYTFSWANQILNFARSNKGLNLTDLPSLNLGSRAGYLEHQFITMKKRDRLWKSIFFAHAATFIEQWVLVSVQSAIQFAPQFAMFNLLKLLEQRSTGASIDGIAWAWVVGLGLSMVVASWIEAWVFWITWSCLGLPVRFEMSAMIFSKAMRRKDVKGVQKAKGESDTISGPIINKSSGTKGEDTSPKKGGDSTKDKDETEEEGEGLQKSRQSTINLVGVDTKRVSDFSAFAFIIPAVITKLIVSMWFLDSMIGWKSLLSGLAVSAISTPFNIYCSKNYSSAQGDLMKVRDQKMSVVTEALQGIRQIKFSALERQWQAKIGAKRTEELATQWKVFCLDTVLISIWILGPVMLSAVSLAVYAVLHGELTPSVAFTTIAVFGQIEGTLGIIPEFTTEALDAFVSVKRVEEYLNAPEKLDYTIPSEQIALENASIAWPSDSTEEDPDRFVLRDINLQFPRKELSVISGKTGAGKSLLLASILGEVDKISGTIKVPHAPSLQDRFDHKANKSSWIIDSAIAFVAQIPWIENASIKDNILFDLPFDAGRYNKVLSACALEKDLGMLPDGEMTDIGANGINLSGGQRWRISFARALYSRAGILVLDDIFSAVDAHVGRQLFEEALTGELGRDRTRILVTHHVGLCLPKTRYAVLLGAGTIEHAGLVEDLQRTGTIAEILKQEEKTQQKEKEDEDELAAIEDAQGDILKRVMSRRSTRSAKIDDGELDGKGKNKAKKFTEDEKRETGAIKIGIYKEYLKTSGGTVFWSLVMLIYLSYMGLILGRSWWISVWTRSYETESFLVQQFSYHHNYGKEPNAYVKTAINPDLWYYLGIYLGLSVLICFMGAFRYFFVFLGSIKASRILFDNLTYTVLRAPLRWLDTVPVGRILNRFTTDFNVVDSRTAYDLGFGLYHILQLIGIIIAGLFVSPYMLLFALILLSLCLFVALRYLAGAREVKRLESNAKSPIFEQFGSVLAGVGTIRAFDKSEAYIQRMFGKIDDHGRAFWHLWLFNRWMGFRLEMVGAVFAILVAGVIVSAKNIDAPLAGFALGFALQYTTSIVWTIRCYANIELNMNATERIVEYSRIAIEDQSGSDVPAAWPTEGRLEVNNLISGYAADLPPVLKGLSFSVAKTERVGVIGRTGAGKSSLTLALFRFLDAREGSIHIDGIDISKIKLHDLRGRLAIIPQDPVLFSGTVRTNLDAFDEHTDAELRDALERVHLIQGTGLTSRDEVAASGSATGSSTPTAAIDTNTNIFTSLSSRISEGGLNLSQGQRQLLCLARAIVSHPKIMVLDEATSAVDMATDVLIQRSIREEFGDSTLIVIAHRLSTIADFDRILVMSDGRAVEYDSPRKLWEQKGVFWEMVGQSGEKEKLEEIIGVVAGGGNGSEGVIS